MACLGKHFTQPARGTAPHPTWRAGLPDAQRAVVGAADQHIPHQRQVVDLQGGGSTLSWPAHSKPALKAAAGGRSGDTSNPVPNPVPNHQCTSNPVPNHRCRQAGGRPRSHPVHVSDVLMQQGRPRCSSGIPAAVQRARQRVGSHGSESGTVRAPSQIDLPHAGFQRCSCYNQLAPSPTKKRPSLGSRSTAVAHRRTAQARSRRRSAAASGCMASDQC